MSASMAKEAPYTVLVRELPVHRRFEVRRQLVGEWVKGLPMRDALGAPDPDPNAGEGVAELDLYADGTHCFATGTFKGYLTVAAAAASAHPPRARREAHGHVHAAGEMPSDDDEPANEDGAEVVEGDLDVFPFDGEKIDLEPLFREQFVLADPVRPAVPRGLQRPVPAVRYRPEFRYLQLRETHRSAPGRTQGLEIALVNWQ